MHTCDRTYIYHIYTFNLTINNIHTLKNTLQERSFCVIYEVLTINEIKSKIRFFRAIIILWFWLSLSFNTFINTINCKTPNFFIKNLHKKQT